MKSLAVSIVILLKDILPFSLIHAQQDPRDIYVTLCQPHNVLVYKYTYANIEILHG